MNWTICINQKLIIESGADIDIVDACILNFIVGFSHSSSIDKIFEDKKVFYWFSHSAIASGLPMLKLKKDAIYRRMKDLCLKGFLEQHKDSQKLSKSYYAISQKTIALHFSPTDERPKGTDERPTGYEYKTEAPTDERPTNPSTNNSIINILIDKDAATIFFKNDLKNDLDPVRIKNKLSSEDFNSKIDEFLDTQFRQRKKWTDEGDMIKHFENWLPKSPKKIVNDFKSWSKEQFYEDCKKYQDEFDDKVLIEFFNVWIKTDEFGQMAFQKKDTWGTEQELIIWKVRNSKKNNNSVRNFKTAGKISGTTAILNGSVSYQEFK